MYLVAIVGLGVLIFWVSRSQRAQFNMINSMSSPFNTGDPAKADKKLHNMGINKRRLPSLSLVPSENKKQVARLNNDAKFPEPGYTPTSQHEVYARHKGAVAASDQEETLVHQSVPTGYGDRHDVVAPGEKLQAY